MMVRATSPCGTIQSPDSIPNHPLEVLFLRLLGDDLSLILHHAPKMSTGVLMGKPELAVIRDVTFLKKA